MLTALLADIHANREALSACLAHAQACGVQRYIFLGDYVGYGAEPGWAVDTVAAYVEAGAVALLGNHDAAVFSDVDMNETARAALAWTRGQLDDGQRDFLHRLPFTAEEGDRLFVHASAWEPAGWDYVTGPAAALRSFMATPHRMTFCGHLHVPELFHLSMTAKLASFVPVAGAAIPLTPQRRWLAVLGAVGQPRDGIPAASYALLDDERDTLTYVRVPYDVESAAAKVQAAGLPAALSLRLAQGR
jgi:diadenosine tetraphosphatase ApaH/serine/threonine PP2A family protein phosphatase